MKMINSCWREENKLGTEEHIHVGAEEFHQKRKQQQKSVKGVLARKNNYAKKKNTEQLIGTTVKLHKNTT